MEEIKKLYRFTTLPFLLDLLVRQELTSLNPNKWEDQNDKATLKTFLEKKDCASVYVLCLTLKDTIHHWNAFANGTAGCCIQFHADRLFQMLDKTEGVSHGPTKYLRMRELDSHQHTIDDLPYVKRGIFTSSNTVRFLFPTPSQCSI